MSETETETRHVTDVTEEAGDIAALKQAVSDLTERVTQLEYAATAPAPAGDLAALIKDIAARVGITHVT